MSRIATIIPAVCLAAVLATSGCDATAPESPAPPTATPPAPPPAELEPTGPAPGTTAEGQAVQQWPMPDLVGSVLQDAQNQIQQLTGGAVFYTGSHDLSGADRNQMVDSNWKVCTQSVAPGATLTPTSRIDFGVVKLDESCP